jgi:transcriptional regulator with XRE-family HTH domain
MGTPVRFRVTLLEEDMAAKGLNASGLARLAKCAVPTVTRFLSGEAQTAKTLAKLAGALGHDAERYIVRSEEVRA